MLFPMFIITLTILDYCEWAWALRIKNIFTKTWANLENELSVMNINIMERFQIDPWSFGHFQLPSTQINASQMLSFKRILLFSM